HIAKALSLEKGKSKDQIFISSIERKEIKKDSIKITLDDMIRFFRNPVQEFMKQELNLKIPDAEEQTIDREAFSISGLEQYTLGSLMVEKKSASCEQIDLYPVLKANGSLPLGEKGRSEYNRIMTTAGPVIEKAVKIAEKKQWPALSKEISVGDMSISANLRDIMEDAAIVLTYGKLNGARLISGWLNHLFLNIVSPSNYPKETHLIGRDPKGKNKAITYAFPSIPSEAKKIFKDLVSIYNNSRQQPFYFFCETAWQFIQVLSKKEYSLDPDDVFYAMNRSKANWYGGYYQTGEKENPYVSLCVENNDPFENIDALIKSGFPQNAVTVFRPL
ncbi:MAG: hypothetical protein GY699_23390, partial [Desulfobacteraceae bacterium]|nr:hypothetical protein [Desulfobacteraceae bacterium]